MLALLSRGGSRTRQPYISSSCLYSFLTSSNSQPAAPLRFDPVPRSQTSSLSSTSFDHGSEKTQFIGPSDVTNIADDADSSCPPKPIYNIRGDTPEGTKRLSKTPQRAKKADEKGNPRIDGENITSKPTGAEKKKSNEESEQCVKTGQRPSKTAGTKGEDGNSGVAANQKPKESGSSRIPRYRNKRSSLLKGSKTRRDEVTSSKVFKNKGSKSINVSKSRVPIRLVQSTRKDSLTHGMAETALALDMLDSSKNLSGPETKEVMKFIRDRFNSEALNHNYSSIKEAMESKPRKQSTKRPGVVSQEIKVIDADDLKLIPIDPHPPQVPGLSYGLERVLFNPGVYHLQDPRSRVFNFDPYLQTIMPVNEFDFNALKRYITSSKDKVLLAKAAAEKKKYTGSTSSMTSVLAHFHFLLSQWREINTGLLSKTFPVDYDTFTTLQRGPVAVFLLWKDGTYAIDADKEYDTSNILMMLGKSMEKLLTLSTEEFERYRKKNSDQISDEERNESEEFHYSTIGDFLLRSQLDAHDPRLPGTGMFDLKTRAVVSVRMDVDAWEEAKGYQIHSRHGAWESFEREYYDMIRSAFLKYSLQVRMGRMDGIFVAFHNTERIFGFQYISISEMDYALHGTEDTTLGDCEFKLSLELMNRVLDRATARFPEKSLRLHFETRDGVTPFMYIFAEPVEDEAVEKIQVKNKKKIDEFQSQVLGVTQELTEEERQAGWEALRAKVEERIEEDELDPDSREQTRESGRSEVGEACSTQPRHSDEILSTVLDVSDNMEEDELVEKYANGLEHSEEPGNEEFLNESTWASEPGHANKASTFDKDAEGSELREEIDEAPEAIKEDRILVNDENTEGNLEVSNVSLDNENSVPLENTSSAIDELNQNDPLDSDTNPDISQAADSNKTKNGTNSEVKPLFAMTLTLRNVVNGEYVDRPSNLTKEDKWTVEYDLGEVTSSSRAHELYKKCQTRRKVALTSDRGKVQDTWNNKFLENIKKLTVKGKVWREKQDKIEASMAVKTLDMKDGKAASAKNKERLPSTEAEK